MIRLNNTIKIPFTIIGALGLTYAFYIYFNAIDFVDSSEGIPFSVPLIVTVTVIWLAAILVLNQIGDLKTMDYKTRLNPIKSWDIIFKGSPKWVLALAIASFIFGMIHLGMMISNYGVTGIIDNKYVIHSHGKVIEELTEKEFVIEKSKELKAITAIHILFLGMGTAILYPRKKRDESY
jgi:hypothetical protein